MTDLEQWRTERNLPFSIPNPKKKGKEMERKPSKTCCALNMVCMSMLIAYIASSGVLMRGVKGTLYEECSKEIDKVSRCLSYATGKEATPPKDCCDSVKDIKDSKPECLCFIIQQSANASSSTVTMGIQVDKLLHLPSVCQLKNASTSYCPKLLGIPANSPDAAIFSNSTATTSSTPGSGPTIPDNKSQSHQSKHGRPAIVGTLLIAFAVFLNMIKS